MYAFPSLPLLGYLALTLTTGQALSGAATVLLALLAAAGTLGCLTTLLFNFVAFQEHCLKLSVWVLVPIKTATIPYDRIVSVEIDESSGGVTIEFDNGSKEPEVTVFMPRDVASAARLRDEIRIHQSSSVELGDKVEERSAVSATPVPPLPIGDEKLKFHVEVAFWMRWGPLLVFPVMGPIFAIADGEFRPLYLLGLVGFMGALGLFVTVLAGFQTYLFVHSKRIDMCYGMFDKRKHHIGWTQITSVSAKEDGHLTVKYNRAPLLLSRGGETVAVTRLSPHTQAAVAASVIKSGMAATGHSDR
jgi:hypothetical protein